MKKYKSINARETLTFSCTGNNISAELVEINLARLMQQRISVDIDFFVFDERRHLETARSVVQLIFTKQLLETLFNSTGSIFCIFLRVSTSIICR